MNFEDQSPEPSGTSDPEFAIANDETWQARVEEPFPPPDEFPWPPTERTGVIGALAETWLQSMFRPAAFFRAMPKHGLRSALGYAIPVGVAASGIGMFWHMVFGSLGLFDILAIQRETYDPAGRLFELLFSPLFIVIAVFIGGGLSQLGLRIVGAAKQPLESSCRVFAFGVSPQLLLLFPVVGLWASLVWGAVLTVIGLREVHESTTWRTLAGLLILPMIIGAIVFAFAMLLAFLVGPEFLKTLSM